METENIHLASCLITDPEQRALLLHRKDRKQWQLPGGRLEPGEVAIQAAAREVNEELGVAVTGMYLLDSTVFSQGDTKYFCDWFRATDFEGEPRLYETDTYDDLGYYHLLTRQIGRRSVNFSPNVTNLATAFSENRLEL